MLTPERRQRPGRLLPWLIALLALALLGLGAAYWWTPRLRFAPDPALVGELANTTLLDADTGEPLPGEWPQWRGPRRDGASRETGLVTDWPQDGPKVLWRKPCGEGYSSFAVSGGKLYTMEAS